MTPPLLEVAGLTAGYDQAMVIRDLELSVQRGEIVAVLGANGAGKTTLIRTIAGALRVMQGSVRLDGTDVAQLSASARARRGIATVPDSRATFPSLTVAEHLRLRHRGERLDSAMAFDLFPALAELRGRKAGLLSGGEQQMLAVARAVARRPRLLLLDELSLGLAPVVVESLLPVVHRYARTSGCGVLLVEQHVELALAVADRGYVLSRGAVAMHCPAERLRADHRLLLSSYFGERNGDQLGSGAFEVSTETPAESRTRG